MSLEQLKYRAWGVEVSIHSEFKHNMFTTSHLLGHGITIHTKQGRQKQAMSGQERVFFLRPAKIFGDMWTTESPKLNILST
jgi:hypothetical protein